MFVKDIPSHDNDIIAAQSDEPEGELITSAQIAIEMAPYSPVFINELDDHADVIQHSKATRSRLKKVVVINHPSKWAFNTPGIEVISPKKYLEDSSYVNRKGLRVFNLCNDYAYQKRGYYVSLLAEARGHKVVPSVKHILDLKTQTIVRIVSDELDELIQKSLKHIRSREFELSIYFGRNMAKQHNRLAKELHKLFPAPFLRAKFVVGAQGWEVESVRTIAFKDIPDSHLTFVERFAGEYFGQTRYDNGRHEKYLYDLAILVDPTEKAPPSNKKALSKFEEVATKMGCYVEFITKDDYNRVGEYDALLIRETTSVNHHTYRFARRAQSEGLAVVDSPEAILKCANKVFLAELLQSAKIPTPKTVIISSEKDKSPEVRLGFPCVLKLPDSSFSKGVVKVNNEEELQRQLKKMLKESDLILAQEFLPTEYDWRIGIVNNEVVFACKYYMAKDHWQIYNWDSPKNRDISGNFENIPLQQVPRHIAETALKATRLIGNGLYGVDVKDINGRAVVIEINDNPNIDAGIEDQLLQDKLYARVLEYLLGMIKH
jgi:glutathione synthase/RimK-type ligase-like ATP-grasp enzyme